MLSPPQFGLNGGGNTLNVIDEVFELRNATVEQMKNLIDGSETGIKKSVIYGGDVTYMARYACRNCK